VFITETIGREDPIDVGMKRETEGSSGPSRSVMTSLTGYSDDRA
jgi:hypothetical protein